MAFLINHTSGGNVSWLQGGNLTSLFSGKTAYTVDWTFRLNSHIGTDNVWILEFANASWIFTLDSVINASVGGGGVSLGGYGTQFNDGLWHRLAITVMTNGGSLKLYADGNLVDTRAFPNATTPVDTSAFAWFGIRQQNDGWTNTLSYSIDQVNALSGTALTGAQLSSIAQGLTPFSAYGLAANRFRYDFTQTLPGTPTLIAPGDAGLVDLDGTLSNPLVIHGTPYWDNGVYSYSNPCVLDAPTIQCSGSSIEFTAKDASGSPILLTYVEGQPVTSPSLTINGGSPFYMTHDGTSTGRRLNIIDGADHFVPNWSIRKQKILNTDVVSVTIPAGLFVGANGAPNILTTKTAVNNAGVLRTNYDGTVASNHPRIGVVGSGQGEDVCEFYWNNMLLNTSSWYEYGGNGQARFTFDSVGNVTGITGSTGSGLPRISLGGSYGLVGGTYTLLYKAGAPYLTPFHGSSEGGAGVTLLDGPTTVGGVTRKRYTVVAGTKVEVQATQKPTDSIQLLDPDGVDGTGYASVGFIRPAVVDMYGHGNMNIFRALTAVNNSAKGFSDLSPDGWFSPWNGYINSNPVTSMTRVVGGAVPPFFTTSSNYTYRCVCPAPHGLVTGQMLIWFGTGGTPGAGGVDGPNDDMIYVDSPTSFYSNWQVTATPNPAFSATYVCKVKPSYGGNPLDINTYTNGMLALDRLVNQCNVCGMDLWFTFPVTWQDDSITQAVTYFATHLNPGLKLYGEYGNEIWNSGSTVFQHGIRAGYQAGFVGVNTGANWTGLRSAQVGYVGRAAWDATKTSLGQPTGGYVRLLSWQSVAASVCVNECMVPAKAYWTAQGYPGKPFDAISMAPYAGGELVGNGVVSGNQRLADWYLATPYGTDLDPEECIDVLEQTIEGYYTKQACQEYYDQICVPEGIPMIFYEWGVDPARNDQTVDTGMPIHNYPGGSVRIDTILAAAQQHKRMGNTYIRTMNIAGDLGCVAACMLGSTGFMIAHYGNAALRWTQYNTRGSDYTQWGDGSGNTDLFVTSANGLGGPPDAPNAFALAKVAHTPFTGSAVIEPTAPVRIMRPGLPMLLQRRARIGRTRYDASCLSVSVLSQGLGSMAGSLN